MEEYKFLLELPWLIVIALLGMFTHFLKKNIKGETPTAIIQYFKDNFKSTLTAIIVTVVTASGYFFQLNPDEFNDIVAIFLIGYMFDSTINKWDSNEK